MITVWLKQYFYLTRHIRKEMILQKRHNGCMGEEGS